MRAKMIIAIVLIVVAMYITSIIHNNHRLSERDKGFLDAIAVVLYLAGITLGII